MHRAVRAIVGGAVGTAVLVFVLLVLEVETRSRLAIFDVVARFAGVPGRPALGFAIVVFAGVFVWPLLFSVVVRRIGSGRDPAVVGMAFAVVLWVAFVALGTGSFNLVLVAVYLGFTLFAHLAYGFTLGAVYARLGRTRAVEGAVGDTT
jgi:hypothetical protein